MQSMEKPMLLYQADPARPPQPLHFGGILLEHLQGELLAVLQQRPYQFDQLPHEVVALRPVGRTTIFLLVFIVEQVPFDQFTLIRKFCCLWRLLQHLQGLDCHRKTAELLFAE